MSVNYIVACWSGLRRVNPERVVREREIFLKKHLASLQNLKHSLDQVTFVFAENPQEPASYREFRKSLPKKVVNAEVVALARPNVGYSFGAYSYVFERYRTSFDHYILMEDDYVYTQDDFDREMLRVLIEDPKRGFVSFVCEKSTREAMTGRARRETPGGAAVADSVVRYMPDEFTYPKIMLGLCRATALEDIWKEFGQLPFSKGVNHTECKFEGQFSLAIAFQKVGWKVEDMLPRYRAEAFGPGGERLRYGPAGKPLFVKPLQFEI